MELRSSDGTVVQIVGHDDDGTLFSDTPVALATIEEAFKPVVAFANDALKALKPIAPSEVEISFGVEAATEAGLFGIAKAQAKGTVQITLTWSKD